MERVWLGMPGDKLPHPEDLSDQEVDSIVDPNASGVPELSPLNTTRRRIELCEDRIATSEGEEKCIASAELARYLAAIDSRNAFEIVEEVLETAGTNGWIRARAEGLRAAAGLPWFILGMSQDDLLARQLEAIELFSHLQLNVRKAEVVLFHALRQFSVDGGGRQATAGVWEALRLADEPETGDEEALRQFVFAFSAHMFQRIAWECERSAGLARRYAAIAILHARLSDSPGSLGVVQDELGHIESEGGDPSRAMPHYQRAARIFRHHEAWGSCFQSLQRIAKRQIESDDLAGARKSLETLKRLRSEWSQEDNLFSVELVEGYLALHEDRWEGAVWSLEPLISLDGVSRATVVAISKDVAHAYKNLGDAEAALRISEKALAVQQRLFKDRLEGQASRFSLSEEIKELRNKTSRDDALLQAILPPTAYSEYDRTGTCDARYYENVAVFYSDFADFTAIASGIPPRQLMEALGEIFDEFDHAMSMHGCERIEVIGDAYLAVAGLDGENESALRMARAALDVTDSLELRNRRSLSVGGPLFVARMGVHVGSVVGGIVGGHRRRFAIFGDAVNTAQRLEAGGTPGTVTLSEEAITALRRCRELAINEAADIDAKGKGLLKTWVLSRRG